ncbi:hypothetical protein CDAR_227361 [Caerostris darwini]|uniref:Uncharacterized protein n=1 Tax=Caerostris darwini TaxID=1538125 RepID=A0AAV4UM43_9ARAC|nr:hypothetical protein CDAR_227361 [Caerostris darwini]
MGPQPRSSIIEKENIPHCVLTHRRTGASSRKDSSSNSGHQAVRERRVHCRRGCGPHTFPILGPQPHHPLLKRKTSLTVDCPTIGASSRRDPSSNSAHQAMRERRVHCQPECGPHSNEGCEDVFFSSWGLLFSYFCSLPHRGPPTPPSIIEKENIHHCGLTHRRTGASSRMDSSSNSGHQAVRERRVHSRRGCGSHSNEGWKDCFS